MLNRRDLYQAHRLSMQRIGMALLAGEPDLPDPPTRRLTVSVFAGAMVGVLVLAGFGIVGLLKPGGATGLQASGTLIIEKETGTKFVYSQQDGKLYPVANYTSARLILNTANPHLRSVSRASLGKFDRGKPVGILGAPDSLPDAGHQVRGPFSMCVRNGELGTGGTRSYSSLVVGRATGGRSLSDREAVVVSAGGQSWVIWHNQRMKLPAEEVRPISGTDDPPEVSTTWLNAVPAGPEFRSPPVPDRGKTVTAPGGGRAAVGTFYRVSTVGGDERWYVLLSDGLAPITQTEGVLLQNDPNSKLAYKNGPVQPVSIDAATANSAQRSSMKPSADGLPPVMPKIITRDGTTLLCVVYSDTEKGSLDARVAVGGSIPAVTDAANGAASGAANGAAAQANVVDQVVIPPGHGALLGLLPAANQPVTGYALLTDQGLRFPVPSADVASKLGLDTKLVAPIPGNLLHLIPQGPTLDPAQATKPVSNPGQQSGGDAGQKTTGIPGQAGASSAPG
ncbi:type VII secretion protein EccB [Actinoallomurus spadix]|uniref:Type VII secretion protein EccB n=1 Tax=Actinoallomurus spadix TaxID=79912 RepID=A0ABN0XL74_9ACTN|nr:type VII secretion protein EccB [Actinoallomurus spadix]MCO5985092.1 type VII secretion protein EccB [Actinoallomurus spadix]